MSPVVAHTGRVSDSTDAPPGSGQCVSIGGERDKVDHILMSVLLNVIWVVFGGFWLFLGYVFFGAVSILFIVTIPASVACFRIATFVLWPFGQAVIRKPGAGAGSAIMNIVWFIVAGFWLALSHVATALLQTMTIIGIPLAIGNLKLIPVTCFPFGKMVVSKRELAYRDAVVVAGLDLPGR